MQCQNVILKCDAETFDLEPVLDRKEDRLIAIFIRSLEMAVSGDKHICRQEVTIDWKRERGEIRLTSNGTRGQWFNRSAATYALKRILEFQIIGHRPNGFLGLSLNDRTIIFLVI